MKNRKGFALLVTGAIVLLEFGGAGVTTAAADRSCVTPSVTVVTDPTGDVKNGPGGSAQDIQSISVAEQYDGSSNKLIFTMKVADLQSGGVSPGNAWRIYFAPSTVSTVYWVDMEAVEVVEGDAVYTKLIFNYGTRTNGSDSTLGSADESSTLSFDYAIHIAINSALVGAPTIGSTLGTIWGRTFYYVQTDLDSDSTGFGSYALVGCGPAPISVVSRKTHGSGGTYDILLPLTGSPGIECRSGGPNGDHSIVFTFSTPVTFSSAFCGGTTASAGISGNDVIVNCTGVANAQTIAITLTSVNNGGAATGDVTVPMGVLLGDTTANGSVNSSDISQTKAQSGTATNLGNFRTDVTVNGLINSSDISTVKSKSGTALP